MTKKIGMWLIPVVPAFRRLGQKLNSMVHRSTQHSNNRKNNNKKINRMPLRRLTISKSFWLSILKYYSEC